MTILATSTRGGQWLLQAPERIFTWETLSDEHRLIVQTAAAFADNEVLPAIEQMERKDWALVRALLESGARSEEALQQLLRSDDADTREMAVRALAGHRGPWPWPWPWPRPRPNP